MDEAQRHWLLLLQYYYYCSTTAVFQQYQCEVKHLHRRAVGKPTMHSFKISCSWLWLVWRRPAVVPLIPVYSTGPLAWLQWWCLSMFTACYFYWVPFFKRCLTRSLLSEGQTCPHEGNGNWKSCGSALAVWHVAANMKRMHLCSGDLEAPLISQPNLQPDT